MARKKRLDTRNEALYCYSWREDGQEFAVSTETWSGQVPVKDKTIMHVYETAPGRGLLWTNTSLKENTHG